MSRKKNRRPPPSPHAPVRKERGEPGFRPARSPLAPQAPARKEREGRRSERPAAPPARAGARKEREERGGERAERKARAPAGEVVRLYGFHSVETALGAPRRELVRLYATEAAAARLAEAAGARGLEPVILPAEEIATRAPRGAVHQGVLLEARPLAPIALVDLPERAVVVLLDQVTDPHNVGAILRTGAAFAIDALVTTERHSPEFAGALAKSASGGLEHVPICSVVNLSRALSELGDRGYLRIGLDSEAEQALEEATLALPLALVLGAEGKGLRRLTRENCDLLARLDLPGPIKSLNVSNACAIALASIHAKLRAR